MGESTERKGACSFLIGQSHLQGIIRLVEREISNYGLLLLLLVSLCGCELDKNVFVFFSFGDGSEFILYDEIPSSARLHESIN